MPLRKNPYNSNSIVPQLVDDFLGEFKHCVVLFIVIDNKIAHT